MGEILIEYFGQLTNPLVNPQNRIFVGYLLAGLVVALIVQCILAKFSIWQSFRSVFARRIWWSKSSRADYLILAINQVVMMGWMPRLATKLTIASLLFETLHLWFDGPVSLWPTMPAWVIATIFTVSLFLLDDWAKYVVHRALHRITVLWCFHKVHHTAEVLTPFTVYRTHPIEGIIFCLRAVVVQATVATTFLFVFGDRVELVTVLGANALLFVFNVTGANLRHSHIWISYGTTLEKIFISPAQHQIHHSIEPRHGNKNFGAVLAIWDWAGSSLLPAEAGPDVRFGVHGERSRVHDLKTIYFTPFICASRYVLRSIRIGVQLMARLFGENIIRKSIVGGTALLLCVSVLGTTVAKELNIYSHRQPFLIKPFTDVYKANTGTTINIVYASKGLAHRLQVEGFRSPADIILTVDIARLHVYADKDLLASISSDILSKNIPAHLRDSANRWFAFSKRARVIAVANRANDIHAIRRYEDLVKPTWRGRICARPGSHVYNRALVASLINAIGIEATELWANGLMKNLARRPQGNDRAQVKAIYEGVCDIAIINNYYFGKLRYSDKLAQRKWADAVHLVFPNQGDRGTHVNISGGGVAKHSKNKEEAVQFLEFLTSKVAQSLYGKVNFEYPVNPGVSLPSELQSWGAFNEDKMPIERISKLAPDAQKIIDRVGW